jgi:hypothetical protein
MQTIRAISGKEDWWTIQVSVREKEVRAGNASV